MAVHDVVEVRTMEHLKLHVRSADGVSGVVPFMPSHLYGVFESLKNSALF